MDVAHDDTTDVVIRNRRYRIWPGLVLLVGLAFFWVIVLGLLLRWLLDLSGHVVIIGTIIAFAVSGGVAQRWIPHPVSRVNLGLFVETWPGGMRYPASSVTQIAFGPDPAEDYVESGQPARLCEAKFTLREGWKFPLVVTEDDVARLRDWAIEKAIPLNDPEGYATRRGGKESSS